MGKTYVEIDSYNNKLYYVKDGQLVFDMDCLMGQEMDEVLELKQKRKDTLSLFDLNCLAVRYEQRSGFLSSFADNSTDTDYDNDKNKILSLSEGIYLHPVSILDDRELSTKLFQKISSLFVIKKIFLHSIILSIGKNNN